jgi:hypothetical protein
MIRVLQFQTLLHSLCCLFIRFFIGGVVKKINHFWHLKETMAKEYKSDFFLLHPSLHRSITPALHYTIFQYDAHD